MECVYVLLGSLSCLTKEVGGVSGLDPNGGWEFFIQNLTHAVTIVI